MKHSARLLLPFALLVSASLCMFGQSAPVTAAHQSTGLSRRLALTRDQRQQFHAITQERKAQAEAVKADTSIPQTERLHKLKEINAGAETKIRELLTPAQLDEYDRIKQERREAARRKRDATVAVPTVNNPPE